jgi:glycine C-acetyltransferase
MDIAAHIKNQISDLKKKGMYHEELEIISAQDREITLRGGEKILNFCANNYLGLANHPALIEAAKKALDSHGYGMSSVRFICGTQDLHRRLEEKIAGFFGTDDAILYAACFDANGGLFEPLLGPEDAIISDTLNHASIIDGVRLCRAKRYIYQTADMADLETRLKETAGCRFKIIATDAVFSMDGHAAPVDQIITLARQYNALVMVDECHSAGVVGPSGRGVTELLGVHGQADIITGTLGKAFGGALGGFTTGRQEIIDMLRQRSRPYLFSNTLPPVITAASIKAFELLEENNDIVSRLHRNRDHFISQMKRTGFTLKPTDSAICAVMVGDAVKAQEFAAQLRREGIFVIAFAFPIVPKEQARIRVQISAAHTTEDLDRAVRAFCQAGELLGVHCPS